VRYKARSIAAFQRAGVAAQGAQPQRAALRARAAMAGATVTRYDALA
jgi:hypothetical protein